MVTITMSRAVVLLQHGLPRNSEPKNWTEAMPVEFLLSLLSYPSAHESYKTYI
jgi:hypothetical protein